MEKIKELNLLEKVNDLLNNFFSKNYFLKYCEYSLKIESGYLIVKLYDNLRPSFYTDGNFYLFNSSIICLESSLNFLYYLENNTLEEKLYKSILSNENYIKYISQFNKEI